MLNEARNKCVRVPDRNVVDAAHDFLPATPLDPNYVQWLATKSDQMPRRPPSYFDAPPLSAAGARHASSSH
jgi:hypothetical protein